MVKLAANARELVAVLADEDATETRQHVAGLTLAIEDADAIPNRWLAGSLLADELARWAPALLDEIGLDEGDDDRDGLATFNPDERRAAKTDPDPFRMLWLDAALLRVLAKVDPEEARTARARRVVDRDDPDRRWIAWTSLAIPDGLVRFTAALWRRKVEPRWRRGVDRPAGIVHGLLADRLLPLMGRSTVEGARLLDARGQPIGRVLDVAAVDPVLVRQWLPAFRTTIAHKLIRFFALEAHAANLRGDGRPGTIHVDGGLVGLASILGRVDTRAPDELRVILDAGRVLDLSAPGLEVHGLWHANTITRAAPGQRAVLEIVLNERVFLPGTAHDMKAAGNSRPAKRARQVVPVLLDDPPHRLPQHREWGPAWSVALGVLVRLVEGREALAREGGVLLDTRAWRGLVEGVGLDRGRATAVRCILLEGDGEAPPLLEATGPDRFTLAPTHAAELAFIAHRRPRPRYRPPPH